MFRKPVSRKFVSRKPEVRKPVIRKTICYGVCGRRVPNWVTPTTCHYCSSYYKCSGCDKLINSTHKSRMCNACIDEMKVSYIKTLGDIDPSWVVKVTLKGYSSSHCGYCSEPDEATVKDIKKVMYFPATTKIVESAYTMDSVLSKIPLSRFRFYDCECQLGLTEYFSLKGELVEKHPHMELDDWTSYVVV